MADNMEEAAPLRFGGSDADGEPLVFRRTVASTSSPVRIVRSVALTVAVAGTAALLVLGLRGGERQASGAFVGLAASEAVRLSSASCPAPADWIIVGGGAGGCAAAAALADAGQDVLLLERGPSDLDIPSTQHAKGWPKSVNDAGEVFRFKEGVWGIVAKVLGGGTALNGGLFFEMPQSWYKENMPAINYAEILSSARRLADELTVPSQPTPFGLAWNQALTDLGHGAADLNAPMCEVCTDRPMVPYTTLHLGEPGGPRYGAAKLMHNRKDVPNLRVVTEVNVMKIIFEGTKAVGVKVKFEKTGVVCDQVTAKKGVIMAAGAVRTPQLLQISGVGPKDVLKELGVEPVSIQANVGTNFVDRLVACVAAMSPVAIEQTIGYTIRVDCKDNDLLEGVGGGEIGTELALASIGMLAPLHRDPILRSALNLVFETMPPSLITSVNQMSQAVNLQLDTKSRGYVKAVSTDSTVSPEVSANYFSDPYDLKSQVARLKELTILLQTEAMSKYTISKTSPELVNAFKYLLKFWRLHVGRRGAAVSEAHHKSLNHSMNLIDSALACIVDQGGNHSKFISVPCMPDLSDHKAAEKYARDNLQSSYHYFGTMAHAIDTTTLAVNGVTNLHVADASAIPVPTMANPQGVIMALGHYLGCLVSSGVSATSSLESIT